MEKSIASSEYAVFLRWLREARGRVGLTQVELAAKLGQTQSFVSKCERGERRLDVVEVRSFCAALGVSFASFASELDRAIEGQAAGDGPG